MSRGIHSQPPVSFGMSRAAPSPTPTTMTRVRLASSSASASSRASVRVASRVGTHRAAGVWSRRGTSSTAASLARDGGDEDASGTSSSSSSSSSVDASSRDATTTGASADALAPPPRGDAPRADDDASVSVSVASSPSRLETVPSRGVRESAPGSSNGMSTAAIVVAVTSAATFATFALEGDRRRRARDRDPDRDPDLEVLEAAREVMELAVDLARGAPNERNATRAAAAVEEVRRIEGRVRARAEARRRAEEWKERVRVKGGDDRREVEVDDRKKIENELAARRRAREAREKKPPITGASAQWVPANEYLDGLLKKESVDHPIDERASETVEDTGTKEATDGAQEQEYPPELVEAMRRMEVDIASGRFTEEAILEKYADVLDTFGEEFAPVEAEALTEEEDEEHPQLLDPYWWRQARALNLITVSQSSERATRFFSMQMVPDNIPERARPRDRFHIVAFESKKDAENFCFFMQSKREEADLDDDLRGFMSTSGVGPKELQQMADDVDHGVTVIGAGRIDLSPNRSHVDVLNHITHIGGEAYLWEFARQVKRDFDAENA